MTNNQTQALLTAIDEGIAVAYVNSLLADEKSRIASRLAYMFANAPETYWAIKQILYAD